MNDKSVLWRGTVQPAADRSHVFQRVAARKAIGDNCCNRARNRFGVSRFAWWRLL
jgi:hypothetical protein